MKTSNVSKIIALLTADLFRACVEASAKDFTADKAKHTAAVNKKIAGCKGPLSQYVECDPTSGSLRFKNGVKARLHVHRDNDYDGHYVQPPRNVDARRGDMSTRQLKRYRGGLTKLAAMELELLLAANPKAVETTITAFRKHYNC